MNNANNNEETNKDIFEDKPTIEFIKQDSNDIKPITAKVKI